MSETVLIVDDDPVQRRLLETMVQRFGYAALMAEGGDAAASMLTGADAAQVDCVVLDLVMPDLDGLGVLARMRDAGLDMPVIVQTAHGGIDNVVSAMRAGATDFVVKPAGAERLQVSLRNALATRARWPANCSASSASRDGTLTLADIITRAPRDEAGAARGREGGRLRHPGADRRRIRRRQGIDRARHPRLRRAPRQAVRRGQLRRDAGEPGRVRFCSATRRAPSPAPPKSTPANSSRPTAARCSSTRSANCRCRRRSSCCAPCRRAKSSRSAARKTRQGRRAHHLRHQPRPDRRRESRTLPRGPVLSPARLSDHACRRCAQRPEDIPELARHFLARFAAEEGKRVHASTRAGARAAVGLPLAGQCAPARKCRVPRGRAGRRRRDRRRRIPAGRGPGRCEPDAAAADRCRRRAIVSSWPDVEGAGVYQCRRIRCA